MKSLFEICQPREDIQKGSFKESDLAADLAQVINGRAPEVYQDAATFFANTFPTEGLKALLKNVCLRLTGKGGEAAAIFRLDTQYGGGKTHSLIALTHAARGMRKVANVAEFIDPSLVPQGPVRVAAFDGENADPANGRQLGDGIKAYTPWGEIACALAGKPGYERIRQSDEQRVAPGAETLRELFGGEPTLILLDELSVYLRKVKGRGDADQLTPFLTSLFKAIESAPGAVLVFTLAIGKGGTATDAYTEENEFLAAKLDEAMSVSARKATLLDPTAEHETAQVLRRRLFAKVDEHAAGEIVAAYQTEWNKNSAALSQPRIGEDRADEFRRGYPLHPALMSTLTDKLSTLADFQRVRGMLRLLTNTVSQVWHAKPAHTHAVHLHHLDPGAEATRNEINTKLQLHRFDPAIRNDVSSGEGTPSLAQQLDARDYTGMAPYGSFVARTILWNTFAFNEHLQGLTAEELRWSVLAPDLDPSFLEDARQKFVAQSAYLDDRPAAPMRFLSEANLNLLIVQHEKLVDTGEAHAQLQDRIRGTFERGPLSLVPFPSGPYEVGDDVGDGRPQLVVISYDAESLRPDTQRLPQLVERIAKYAGSQNAYRQNLNNLVFLIADEQQREVMKRKMVRRLALDAMRAAHVKAQLAEHQQEKVEEYYQRSEHELAVAIQQCYRHLFFPSRTGRADGAVDLAHTAFDTHSASETPGSGQVQVLRALADNRKLLRDDDAPLAPAYVRDRTPLKKGQITTAVLRAEFRRDPALPIMIGDQNFVAMVRKGIEEGAYVYRSGELLVGHGDPPAEVKIDEQSFVFTVPYAKEQNIWPRPAAGTSPGTAGPGVYLGGGALAGGGQVHGGMPQPVVNQPTLTLTAGARSYRHEAPLREALTRIWEEAKRDEVERIARLTLRVFETTDAFRLLSAVGGVSGAEKLVRLDASYETAASGSLQLTFKGTPADAAPLREFLEPQFRAASESDLQTTFELTFGDGLALDGRAAEDLTERLARFASGAALVEAWAEEKV